MIASSDLLGYTWVSLVRGAMRHLRLTELCVKELAWPFRVGVVYRKGGYLSPAARRFVEILRTTAKEITKSPEGRIVNGFGGAWLERTHE